MGVDNDMVITQDMLKVKGWANEKISSVLGSLVQSRACIPRKNKSGQVVCVFREQSLLGRLKTLSPEDYKVFCCIEEVGSTAIWTADIKKKTLLPTHVIQKAVKNLCDVKRIIKQVTNIQHKNRKFYMLAHLEASKEVAGGSFYSNGEFNNTLVEQLRSTMVHVLQNGQQCTFSELAGYVRSSGIGGDLSDADLKTALQTLLLENSITETVNRAGDTAYSWCKWPQRWPCNVVHVDTLPCASCPVSYECTRGGGARVSPENCEYLDMWLSYKPIQPQSAVSSPTGSSGAPQGP
eukprot:Lankesteria_metandrocarpae@DN3025_c0_g1_i1.p1